MSMTHKEALERAVTAHRDTSFASDEYRIEASIRAYIEARGLVLVPKGDWVTRKSAHEAIVHVTQFNGTGRTARAIAMLAAAPDPFAIDTEDGQ